MAMRGTLSPSVAAEFHRLNTVNISERKKMFLQICLSFKTDPQLAAKDNIRPEKH